MPTLVPFVSARRAVQGRRLFGEFAWVVVGNLVALVGTSLGVKVLTTQLGVDEYGRFALAMTVPQIAVQILYGPLITTFARFVAPMKETGELAQLIGTTRQLVVWLTGPYVTVLMVAALVLVGTGGTTTAFLLIGASAFGLFQGLAFLLNAVEVSFRMRARAALNQVLISLTRLGFGGGAAVALAPTAVAATFGMSVGMALVSFIQFRSFRAVVGADVLRLARPSAPLRKVLLSYASSFWLFGAFTAVQLTSDVWALRTFADDRTVGVYALGLVIASGSIVVAGAAVSQLVVPVAFQWAGHSHDPQRLARSARVIEFAAALMAALTLAGVSAALALGEPIILLLSTTGFREAAIYLPWLVLGLGLSQIGNLLALVPMAMTRMRRYTVLKIAVSVITVAMNFSGAGLLGIAGVCGSLVVSGIVYVLLMLWLNHHLQASAPTESAAVVA